MKLPQGRWRLLLFLILLGMLSDAAMAQCNLTVSFTQNNVSCNGSADGSATANPSNGSPPYTYNWSNGATTAGISNLAPGNYVVTVADSLCAISGIELVTNGDFSAGNTGFTSDYAYTPPPNTAEGQYWVGTGSQVSSWNGGMFSNGDHTTGTGNLLMVNGSITAGLNIWCQTITVTPNVNYDFSTWISSLNAWNPALLQFYINGVALSVPFTAPANWGNWIQFFTVWNSGANTSANICIVNQNTQPGGNDFALDDISFQECTPCTAIDSVTITEPPVLSTTVSSTDDFCNQSNGTATVNASGGTSPYTYLWNPSGQTTSTVSGLAAGNYSVTVTDNHGCTAVDSVTITAVSSLSIAVSSTDDFCNQTDGTATVTVTGGTSPYVYLWNPSGQTTSTASGLSAGNYSVTVTDNGGCTASANVTIAGGTITLTVSADVSIHTGESTQLTASGATTYLWQPAGSLSANNIPDPMASPTVTTTYTVYGTDANGCQDSAFVTVIILQDIKIGIANAFTPNGDGINDVIKIMSSGNIELLTFKIFNRWGQLVFETNDINQGWDGNYRSTPQDIGTYVYYINSLDHSTGVKTEMKGNITLLK